MSKRLFKKIGSKELILNKCPFCGSELEYSALYQYEKVYKITKYGTLAKNPKCKRDTGSMECGYIVCTNHECDFHTDCDLDVEDYRNIHVYQDGRTYMYTDDNS